MKKTNVLQTTKIAFALIILILSITFILNKVNSTNTTNSNTNPNLLTPNSKYSISMIRDYINSCENQGASTSLCNCEVQYTIQHYTALTAYSLYTANGNNFYIANAFFYCTPPPSLQMITN